MDVEEDAMKVTKYVARMNITSTNASQGITISFFKEDGRGRLYDVGRKKPKEIENFAWGDGSAERKKSRRIHDKYTWSEIKALSIVLVPIGLL